MTGTACPPNAAGSSLQFLSHFGSSEVSLWVVLLKESWWSWSDTVQQLVPTCMWGLHRFLMTALLGEPTGTQASFQV